jgi:putative flippase GtrA
MSKILKSYIPVLFSPLKIRVFMDLEKFYQFLRFGIVGFSGVFVDFGLTWLLKEKLKINQYLANSLGFLVAVIWNFWLNRVWTFASTDPNLGAQFGKYFLASLLGLALNNGLIWFFTKKMKLTFYPAKLAATGIVVVWNFWANSKFTFK